MEDVTQSPRWILYSTTCSGRIAREWIRSDVVLEHIPAASCEGDILHYHDGSCWCQIHPLSGILRCWATWLPHKAYSASILSIWTGLKRTCLHQEQPSSSNRVLVRDTSWCPLPHLTSPKLSSIVWWNPSGWDLLWQGVLAMRRELGLLVLKNHWRH